MIDGEAQGPWVAADHHIIILAAGRSLRLSRLTQELPKSLLQVENKPILGHSLDFLSRRGFRRLTLVVGYRKDRIETAFGARYGNIDIKYAENPLFAESEHGWSLYCARGSWSRNPGPVVFMDADNLYDPAMIDRMMTSTPENVMLVDENLSTEDREEELVLGADGVVTALRRGQVADFPNVAGGFVGINRFSREFMQALFAYMDDFFARRGKMHKYERVFDAFIGETGARVDYLPVGDLNWINVNHEADYELAKRLARKMMSDA